MPVKKKQTPKSGMSRAENVKRINALKYQKQCDRVQDFLKQNPDKKGDVLAIIDGVKGVGTATIRRMQAEGVI